MAKTTTTKKKLCKGCGKKKPMGEFPNSPHTADGKLGFCLGCWSKKVGGKRRGKVKDAVKTKTSALVHAANEAISAAGSLKEKFLVRADDGDLAEFSGEEKALRQAMEWKMAGFAVTVWRQCEFEMVLRIIG